MPHTPPRVVGMASDSAWEEPCDMDDSKSDSDRDDEEGDEMTLEGLQFVVTGEFPHVTNDRTEVEKILKNRGARVVGAISRYCTHIIVGRNPGQVKRTAALAMGDEIAWWHYYHFARIVLNQCTSDIPAREHFHVRKPEGTRIQTVDALEHAAPGLDETLVTSLIDDDGLTNHMVDWWLDRSTNRRMHYHTVDLWTLDTKSQLVAHVLSTWDERSTKMRASVVWNTKVVMVSTVGGNGFHVLDLDSDRFDDLAKPLWDWLSAWYA